MGGARIRLFSAKLLALTGLVCFTLTTSGCATRALMSSDRYEKPEPETQQFRSSDDLSSSMEIDEIRLHQHYIVAIERENRQNTAI